MAIMRIDDTDIEYEHDVNIEVFILKWEYNLKYKRWFYNIQQFAVDKVLFILCEEGYIAVNYLLRDYIRSTPPKERAIYKEANVFSTRGRAKTYGEAEKVRRNR